MKTRTCIFIAAVSLLAMAARGQERVAGTSVPSVFADLKSYEECNLGKYERNFLGSLQYPDNAIVESGLAQVAMLKLAQPDAECKRLRKKIDHLVFDGETTAVRYKAYLTSIVFDHPEMFTFEKYGRYMSGDDLFRAIAQRLEATALAAF